jgi:aryl-alcohol dehydrogenase-like predicted oxidoreductase
VSGAMRGLGPFEVPPIGLGCMNLSHAYGIPPEKAVASRVLLRALELGVVHFDSAALYGFGRNETLVGEVLKPHRQEIVLISKGGMTGRDGVRVIDGRPESILRDCEESLERLQTEVIDLYYLHRWDKNVPIEDSVGAMSRLVEAGKVRAIGLSEVSADTLRKANATYPISAVQSEYSPWTRNPEVAVLEACRETGAAFVAFSPLARGFLANTELNPDTFVDKDLRLNMPRFREPHFSSNRELLPGWMECARSAGCTPAQLALAWVLAQGEHIHAIPGTTSESHLEEDVAAMDIVLSGDIRQRIERLINPETVSGARYPEAVQTEIDTEELNAA